jgi:hypothetical protein
MEGCCGFHRYLGIMSSAPGYLSTGDFPHTFQDVNGAGGVGIMQNGNSTLLYLLNSQNKMELWWWNQMATNAYPVGAWVKGMPMLLTLF